MSYKSLYNNNRIKRIKYSDEEGAKNSQMEKELL